MVGAEACSHSFKYTSVRLVLSFIMMYKALHDRHYSIIVVISCAALQVLVRMCSATCNSAAPRSIQHTHYMQQLIVLMAELLKQEMHYLVSDRHQIHARHMAAFIKKVSKRQSDIRKLSAQLSRLLPGPIAVTVCHAVMAAVLGYALSAMSVHAAFCMSFAHLPQSSAQIC